MMRTVAQYSFLRSFPPSFPFISPFIYHWRHLRASGSRKHGLCLFCERVRVLDPDTCEMKRLTATSAYVKFVPTSTANEKYMYCMYFNRPYCTYVVMMSCNFVNRRQRKTCPIPSQLLSTHTYCSSRYLKSETCQPVNDCMPYCPYLVVVDVVVEERKVCHE